MKQDLNEEVTQIIKGTVDEVSKIEKENQDLKYITNLLMEKFEKQI